ncbi:cytochrome b2 [Exophiala viscosa]|uniref:L-lactate dehydrogenase (cytochrome) n=1 Tax=Exophiala viscosa TaxID=2486360 RepID=A0AAN6DMY3_9EURO|nr:cytochrome b2 [Exophiala viscosa]KAI1620843.1 cytochrome b2 [Exophiala viscosa]
MEAESAISRPPLLSLISSYDFEETASRSLSKKTWAFYSSAATDEITRKTNKTLYDRIWFRPRVMRNVREVNTRSKILGCDVALPFFVSPAAMAKLVHPDGELAIARGCSRFGIGQCISSNASYDVSEIVACGTKSPFFLQLYVNKDRASSEALLRRAEECGIRAVFVTVDAPVPGKREADERVPVDRGFVAYAPMTGASASNDSKGGGLGRTMGAYIDATLNWDDLEWLRRSTKLPVVLKGIQTVEDAILAAQYGVDGIFISNHGGRSLDTSPPSILTLMEIRQHHPELFEQVEVYVDSGIRRGTDILKALCLGAKVVGMGRPFLYALNYGQEGIEQFIGIMKDELETAMRLVGITSLDQAHPGLLNTCDINHLVTRTIEASPMALPVKARL